MGDYFLPNESRFGLDVSVALGISSLGYLASFLGGVMIARLLGVEGKGLFTLLQTTVTAIFVFSSFGTGHGQMFYVSKDPDKIKHFIPNAYLLSIVVIGSSAVLFFVTGQLVNFKIVNILGWPAIVLGILLAPIMSILTFQGQYFLAIHAYKLSKTRLAVTESMSLVAYLVLYTFGQITIINMLLAFALSNLVSLILFHMVIQQYDYKGGGFSLSFAKESFSFGIRQYSSDLVLYSVSRLDFFLVTYFLGQSGLGIYSVAVSLAEITMRLPSELGTILFPAFAAEKIPSGQAAPILRKTFFLAILAALTLFMLGDQIVLLLFGKNFNQAIAAFRWLLPGTVAWSTIFVTWNHTSARGRPELGIPIFAAAALLDAILNIILLQKLGVVGASIAATSSYLLAAILFLRIFLKAEGCSVREALVVKHDDIRSILRRI